jgi:hypothetical protein
VKQKLELTKKFENGELVTKSDKHYGIGNQTIYDIKNNKMKSMEFVRNCDSGAGPSNHKSMKKSLYEEVDFDLLQWFNQQ